MKNYTAQQAKRDLNPHAEAIAARYLWGDEYARSGLGSMGFWDTLSDSRKRLCADLVEDIQAAKPAEYQP